MRVALLFLLACAQNKSPRESLLIAGNSSLVHHLQALVKEFETAHPDVRVVVEPGGTTAAVIALKRGAIDIAALSRQVTYDEDDPQLRDVQLGRDSLAVLVHKDNPLNNVTRHQLDQIFEGEITHWETLTHGEPRPVVLAAVAPKKKGKKPEAAPLAASLPSFFPRTLISVHVRGNEASVTRSFNEMVLGGDDPSAVAHVVATSDDMLKVIGADPNAIGYVSSRHTSPAVRALQVDGVELNHTTVLSGRYPLSRTFFLATYQEPSKPAQAFMDYALSAAGQATLAKAGLIPVR